MGVRRHHLEHRLIPVLRDEQPGCLLSVFIDIGKPVVSSVVDKIPVLFVLCSLHADFLLLVLS